MRPASQLLLGMGMFILSYILISRASGFWETFYVFIFFIFSLVLMYKNFRILEKKHELEDKRLVKEIKEIKRKTKEIEKENKRLEKKLKERRK